MRILAILAWFLFVNVLYIDAQTVRAGVVTVNATQLNPGRDIMLGGDWFYRPDYAVKSGENIESSLPGSDDLMVGVPQLLNRVRWWLDDSEDFKKHEDARLAGLGFDTDKAEGGWYKLVIETGKLPSGKRIFIEFDGVAMKSRVFLNGKELGSHTGMFSRFAFDLTPFLRDGKNLLAVFVSMEKIPVSTVSLGTAVTVNLTASKVLSLSKGMFGPLSPVASNRAYDLHGIWQPARLTVHSEAKIDDVFFVPSLDGARVDVTVRSLGTSQYAVVKTRWVDPASNKTFATVPSQKIPLTTDQTVTTLNVRNLKPKLWTPATPNLYRLEVTLETENGAVLDRFQQRVGFRTFEARGNQLYLNGQRYWLRGANQLPYGKDPWDPVLARQLIQMMHDNNQRITRTHATPWNEAWLDAADEIGLGVSVEGIRPWAFVGKIGATPPDLFQHWLLENADVVKRIRNHPSVLIWTIGNEMLLRDSENIEKWKQLSQVVKQTRALDGTRPTVVSSSYIREPELYEKHLAPNGIDDGDIDDVHSYRGWYADSPFVTNSLFERELKHSKWNRPFIGQEMSSGYPDLDTGLPVLSYTKNQISPQAWVGVHSYPGSNPQFFLEHHRAVTKRLAEQLRFQRGDKTAGFLVFSNECWFSHTFARDFSPYPVVDAMKEAFEPVGLALETAQRKFYEHAEAETAVFVTNDDEQFRSFTNLRLEVSFVTGSGKNSSWQKVGNLANLRYYETARVPVKLKMPAGLGRRTKMRLVTRLMNGDRKISQTTDQIEIYPRPPVPRKLRSTASNVSLGPSLLKLVGERFQSSSESGSDADVVFVGSKGSVAGLKAGGQLYNAAINGATVVVFSPGKLIQDLFPNDVSGTRNVSGEFADWTPATGTKLVKDLEPMDLKWWARDHDWRVFVASEAHRLNPKGSARELIRFIPAHGYIPPEKIPEQFMTVLFEIPLGKGRLWICDLDLEESVGLDPAARGFAENLFSAAADSNSTRSLVKMPTHEEMLAGKRVAVK
ncbi:MAG: glycoside hydrolase family 2 TIM barrel-domain containing protein [Pyrinomonadaceae bacterium]